MGKHIPRHLRYTSKANFGTYKVEWGTLNRMIRGNKDLPLRGFPDMLSPSYPKKSERPICL
jgi:hypothetical protein